MDFTFNLKSTGILRIIRGNSTKHYINNNLYNLTIEQIKSKTMDELKKQCNIYRTSREAKASTTVERIAKKRQPKCNSKISVFITWAKAQGYPNCSELIEKVKELIKKPANDSEDGSGSFEGNPKINLVKYYLTEEIANTFETFGKDTIEFKEALRLLKSIPEKEERRGEESTEEESQ